MSTPKVQHPLIYGTADNPPSRCIRSGRALRGSFYMRNIPGTNLVYGVHFRFKLDKAGHKAVDQMVKDDFAAHQAEAKAPDQSEAPADEPETVEPPATAPATDVANEESNGNE